MRQALVLLVVLSWITLSGLDALEDLDFDNHTVRDAATTAGCPAAAKRVKLANDIVELANGSPLPSSNLIKHIARESTADEILLDAYLNSKAFRSHKNCCILLI